jgi:predicted GIY-YIG superfamily endonuclease
MYYVYILRSCLFENQIYVGFTRDLKQRFTDHNNGKSKYTAKYKPWKLESYFAFSSQEKAFAFEKYLKTSSGIAF